MPWGMSVKWDDTDELPPRERLSFLWPGFAEMLLLRIAACGFPNVTVESDHSDHREQCGEMLVETSSCPPFAGLRFANRATASTKLRFSHGPSEAYRAERSCLGLERRAAMNGESRQFGDRSAPVT